MRTRVLIALTMVISLVGDIAYAQKPEFGTAAEAKAMLEKTVSAMKADKAKTLAMINKGEEGFKDRDLYPACSGLDGKVTAHPDKTRIGMDRNTMKDETSDAVSRTRNFCDASAPRSSTALVISAGLLDRVRRCHLARATLALPRRAPG